MASLSPHPLEEKLDRLIRRVRRANAIRAAALAGAAAAFSLGMAAAADMLLRSPERGSQLLLAAVFVSFLAAGLRWLWRPIWRARYDRVAIARRVEQAFPELRGLLASAIEFAGEPVDSPLAGSARLRAAVVERAVRVAEPLDFTAVIDLRPARTAIAALLAATVGIGAALWCFPAAAPLSVQRILMPWCEQPWPRRHRLELEQPPAKIATGQDLELAVVDANGRVPQPVELRWRWQGDGVEQRLLGEPTADPARARFRLERLVRPLEVRVTGGDDDTMGWVSIDVVEPPRVASLELRVVPPEYTGEPVRIASQPIRGWIGSRLVLSGIASRPLQDAVLRRLQTLDGPPATSRPDGRGGRSNSERPAESGPRIPVAIADDGLRISLAADAQPPWELREAAVFALEVRDRDGVAVEAARWVVQAVRDQPPVISWTAPPALACCAPTVRVPLRAAITDDLRVAALELRYRLAGAADSRSVALDSALAASARRPPDSTARGKVELAWNWPLATALASAGASAGALVNATTGITAGTATGTTAGTATGTTAGTTAGTTPTAIVGATTAPMPSGWEPGQIIEYWLVARDSAGQSTESPPRRLEVLTPEAVAERLAQRETQLLERLQIALLAQREAQAVASDSSASSNQADAAESKTARGDMAAPGAGLGTATRTATATGAGTETRTAAGTATLTAAAIANGNGNASGPTAGMDAEPLQAAYLAQRLVRRKLDEGGAEVGDADDFAGASTGVRAAVARLLAEAEWSGGADDALLTRLRDTIESLDALLAGPLPAAERELQHAVRRRLERQADWGESLAAARAAQAVAAAALEAIVARLAPWNQLRRHVEELGELRETLAQDLADIEQRLADQTSAGKNEESGERDSPERRRLAERQFESSRRLDRLVEKLEAGLQRGRSDDDWREAVEAAVSLARDASLPNAVWEAGNGVQAGRFGIAAENQRVAVETVDAMLDKMAGGRERPAAGANATDTREPPEAAARREAAEAWRAAIAPWIPRQAAIVESLDALVAKDDAPRRAAAERLERALATEAQTAASDLPASPVYGFALTGAVRDMTQAADRLRERRPDAAREAGRDALRRLERLAAALEEEAESPTMLDEPQAPNETPGDENRRPPQGTLAELQLLRECQADLQRRTATLAKTLSSTNEPPAAADRRLLEELGREQASLAELLEQLLP